MPNVLVVGGSRGLGNSLVNLYASKGWNVFATEKSWSTLDFEFHQDSHTITWLPNVDLLDAAVAGNLISSLEKAFDAGRLDSGKFDVVIISAGKFAAETWSGNGPQWKQEVEMYTISSVAPVAIVHRLVKASFVQYRAKVVLVSSEAGSITLRESAEMNWGHHGSKAALNMVGKLLSYDLKDKGIIVSIVHPGFMRTDMTRDVGLEAVYDKFHAVTPDEAAKSLMEWTEKLDMTKTGQFWAPRGCIDIGTLRDEWEVIGKDNREPRELPW